MAVPRERLADSQGTIYRAPTVEKEARMKKTG